MNTGALWAEFNDLLREWRNARHFSQRSHSDAAGVAQRNLSFLESGQSALSRAMVSRLTEALNVPLRECNNPFSAADFAPLIRETALYGDELLRARQTIDRFVRHRGIFAACLTHRNWNSLERKLGGTMLFTALLTRETWARIDSYGQSCRMSFLKPMLIGARYFPLIAVGIFLGLILGHLSL